MELLFYLLILRLRIIVQKDNVLNGPIKVVADPVELMLGSLSFLALGLVFFFVGKMCHNSKKKMHFWKV